MSVRNLRIREDTAKYLLNLDVNSAYYDPKTRSMRENPLPGTAAGEEMTGNFVRSSGDAKELANMQLYQFEAYEKGQNLHLNADPTTVEVTSRPPPPPPPPPPLPPPRPSLKPDRHARIMRCSDLASNFIR